MKRTAILLGLVLAMFLLASCASYTETWRGPSGKATPVCDNPASGTGYTVGGQEFIPVGYYTWRGLDKVEHREMVYVKRDVRKGAAK